MLSRYGACEREHWCFHNAAPCPIFQLIAHWLCYVPLQVGIVGAVVAAVVLIASLAQPLYENTIKSFPTPAEYELYEQREE